MLAPGVVLNSLVIYGGVAPIRGYFAHFLFTFPSIRPHVSRHGKLSVCYCYIQGVPT